MMGVRLNRIFFDGFDWDSGNYQHCQHHCVDIDEIEFFFNQELLYFEDKRHSVNEKRWIAVGLTRKKRYLFVAYTLREIGKENLIRPISARFCHKKEQVIYEKIKEELIKAKS